VSRSKLEDNMENTIKIEIDHTTMWFIEAEGLDALKELVNGAYEHGRLEKPEGFNIQITIRDCK